MSWSKRDDRDSGSGSSDFSLAHFLNSISGRSKTTGRLKDSETKVCINQFKIWINQNCDKQNNNSAQQGPTIVASLYYLINNYFRNKSHCEVYSQDEGTQKLKRGYNS